VKAGCRSTGAGPLESRQPSPSAIMVQKKRASKRMTLKQKYKVKGKVKEHHRKQRREAKRRAANGGAARAAAKALRKDPGLPNLCPYKETLMSRIEAAKEKVERGEALSRQRRAEKMRQLRGLGGGAGGLEAMVGDAAARLAEYTDRADRPAAFTVAGDAARATAQNRKAYYRQLRKVVGAADIIVCVLDARDPEGCRARAVERQALGLGKRVVLLLNKIDLVPADVARAWLAHLRREFPCLAFKAGTQEQRRNLSAQHGARVGRAARAGEAVTGSGAAGAETLLQLVKNYARNRGIKEAVTVGVIGYPNTGKSSVINSLKRSRAAAVSPTPGHTKVVQEVVLDKKVKLLDCPGIIFDGSSAAEDGGASLLLRNCIGVEALADPEAVAAAVVDRCAPEKLMTVYGLPMYDDADDFLRLVAEKRGMLKAGGTPNKDAAARSVLQDWNAGKVPFFTTPPEDEVAEAEADSARIVSGWSAEFDLDTLMADADAAWAGEAEADADDFVALPADAAAAAADDWVPEDEEEDEEEEEAAGGAGGAGGAGDDMGDA